MNFVPIPPAQLHSVWSFVRDGLKAVAEVGKESWLPEDIYTALRTGRAGLHVAQVDNRNVGFFVVEPIVDPFDSTLRMNCWALYGPGQMEQWMDTCIAELDRICTAMGASAWRLYGRKGWERALGNKVKPVKVVYERVIA